MNAETLEAATVLREIDYRVFPNNPCKIVSDFNRLPDFMRYLPFKGVGYYFLRGCHGAITDEVYYLERHSDPIGVAADLARNRVREHSLPKVDSWFFKSSRTRGFRGFYDIVTKKDVLFRRIPKPGSISWKELWKKDDVEIDSMCVRHVAKSMNLSVAKVAELITARRVPDFVKELKMTMAA